jgi:hypothetical protein
VAVSAIGVVGAGGACACAAAKVAAIIVESIRIVFIGMQRKRTRPAEVPRSDHHVLR